MHPNPSVKSVVDGILVKSGAKNIILIPPVDYLSFVVLMKLSNLILTDSGGVQEEAPSLGKPVLVMRDTTERPEAVEAGTVELVGADREKIVLKVGQLLEEGGKYRQMARTENPYGDGTASEQIVKYLSSNLL